MAPNALSNTLGSISIACWMVVYSPQFLENYTRQSAEGLSVSFVVIWLLGDLFNLTGAVLAWLLPTVIILALYYTLCDIGLLFQIYYYRWKNISTPAPLRATTPSEQSPLLPPIPLPHALPRKNPPGITASGETENQEATSASLKLQLFSVLFVLATGCVAWVISEDGSGDGPGPGGPVSAEWVIQILGWSSASLYFGARIPQILKNFKTRCEGLSTALFWWAIAGNTTYALSICVAAPLEDSRGYWVTNASWLAGSGLVLFLDVIILLQMGYYRHVSREECLDRE